MALSVFADRAARPTPAKLAAMLGRATLRWRAVIERVREAHGPIEQEWSFAGANYGWSLRLKRAGKPVVYLTPQKDKFLASFALGEKACAAARSSGISPAVLAIIDAAPKYAEGRGVRIPVSSRRIVEDVSTLAALKLATFPRVPHRVAASGSA